MASLLFGGLPFSTIVCTACINEGDSSNVVCCCCAALLHVLYVSQQQKYLQLEFGLDLFQNP